jgi:hypothetical protein
VTRVVEDFLPESRVRFAESLPLSSLSRFSDTTEDAGRAMMTRRSSARCQGFQIPRRCRTGNDNSLAFLFSKSDSNSLVKKQLQSFAAACARPDQGQEQWPQRMLVQYHHLMSLQFFCLRQQSRFRVKLVRFSPGAFFYRKGWLVMIRNGALFALVADLALPRSSGNHPSGMVPSLAFPLDTVLSRTSSESSSCSLNISAAVSPSYLNAH